MMLEAIRSLLFVPGDREEMVRKAIASEADAVIIDLEDAVAPERKSLAREVARAVLDQPDVRTKPLFVRLNALDTGLCATDLAGIAGGRPSGVMLPKSAGAGDIARLSHMLDALEAREGLEEGSIRILTVATETPAATLALGQAGPLPSPRLWGLLWGGEDLAATLGAFTNRNEDGLYTFPYLFARSQCLFAANALGVSAIDAVYPDFRNIEGLEAEVRAALRDGFTAKAAIHPAQAPVINRIMTPSEEQLEWARKVVRLLADRGVAPLDGKMVDIAHKRIAERLLSRARALGLTQDDA